MHGMQWQHQWRHHWQLDQDLCFLKKLADLCLLDGLQVPATAVTQVPLPAPKVLRIAAAGNPTRGIAAIPGEL
jgi:hypothetical protein